MIRRPQPITRREALARGLAAGAALLNARAAQSEVAYSKAAQSQAAQGGTAGADLPLIEKAIPFHREKLPVVGIGTNAFGADGPEELGERKAVLGALVRLGGKVVDTAGIYGASEETIGASIASLGIRQKVFLATKVQARSRESGQARASTLACSMRSRAIRSISSKSTIQSRIVPPPIGPVRPARLASRSRRARLVPRRRVSALRVR